MGGHRLSQCCCDLDLQHQEHQLRASGPRPAPPRRVRGNDSDRKPRCRGATDLTGERRVPREECPGPLQIGGRRLRWQAWPHGRWRSPSPARRQASPTGSPSVSQRAPRNDATGSAGTAQGSSSTRSRPGGKLAP
eukprot:scaffold2213_cov444-Prasinococcus_capsulatus_cf.AAC.23